MKTAVYESLHTINQATALIADNIERLKSNGVISPDLAAIHKLAAEEIHAAVCHSAVLSLVEHEQGEAASVEKGRIEMQRRLND